jgi:TRAP-type transport system periplasmic protein
MPTRRTVLRGAVAVPALIGLAGTARAAKFNLKFASEMVDTHPAIIRTREAADAIRRETQGEVDIRIFPNAQLGSGQEMLTQIRTGAVDFYPAAAAGLSGLVPVASISSLGFAFSGYDQVWAAMDGKLGAFIREEIAKTGAVLALEAMWDNGFRQITSSTHPINTPDDLKNFKIRVPVVPLWVSLFSAFGAAPVSIPLNEAYSALQTKIADGQENPLALIESAKFYEVQKYCSLTNHSWDGFWLLSSARIWKTVPKELQEVMQKHFNDAAKKQRDDIVQANAEYRKNLESKGLTFNATKPDDFQAALAKTSFYKDAKAKFGDQAWSLLQKYAGNIG